MTTAKTKTKLWPPIHKLTYTSGQTGWQVACMLKGERIRETFPTRPEAESRAAQIRQQRDNEGAAAFTLPSAARVEAVIDFRIAPNDEVFFLEANSNPWLTPMSKRWTSIPFNTLIVFACRRSSPVQRRPKQQESACAEFTQICYRRAHVTERLACYHD
jgi:hypothetical protein